MRHTDFYSFMGLSRDASQDAIKGAYRGLARTYHPDVTTIPHAESLFKELGQAYGVLKDPQKRAKYDVYLSRQRTEPKPNSTSESNRTSQNGSVQTCSDSVKVRRSILYVFGPIMLLIGVLVADHTLTHQDMQGLEKTLLPIAVESVKVKEILETETLIATAKELRQPGLPSAEQSTGLRVQDL